VAEFPSTSPSTFRCINGACGRTFPRAVRFCPYCGTGQAAPAQRAAPATASVPAPPPVTPPAPVPPQPPAPAPQPPAPAHPPGPAPAPPPARPPASPPVAPPPAARPGPAAQGYQQPQPTVGVPRPPGGIQGGPAQPPLRKPVGKGTWFLVGLLLVAIWFLVKPDDPSKKLDDRVDDAIALTESCRIGDARAALAELRGDKASAAQLGRLQKAISSTAPACEKKTQRAKAWKDAKAALESALSANALDKASTRLSAFVKRWSEDDDTRAMRERIDARRAEKLLDDANVCLEKKDRACAEAKLDAAEKLRRPESRPRIEALREALSRMLESTLLEGQGGQASQAAPGSYPPPLAATPPRMATAPVRTALANPAEARQLQAQAEREIGQGNYRSAIGLAGQCATLGSPECAALRDRATHLERELHACMQAGREWVGERCE
jgi:hypothetical protein